MWTRLFREQRRPRRRYPAWLGGGRATFSELPEAGQDVGGEWQRRNQQTGEGRRARETKGGGSHSYMCTDLGSGGPWGPWGALWPGGTLHVKVRSVSAHTGPPGHCQSSPPTPVQGPCPAGRQRGQGLYSPLPAQSGYTLLSHGRPGRWHQALVKPPQCLLLQNPALRTSIPRI